jgi:hypothetical protein
MFLAFRYAIHTPMFSILLIYFGLFSFQADGILDQIEQSIKIGSAKELVKYCNESVELKIDGNSASYSRIQAEVVLRGFFQKNPVRGFSYIHQGSSPEGLRYAIGKYVFEGGSYRVVMFLKKSDEGYQIDTLNFSKE